jgi:hypothetical protein
MYTARVMSYLTTRFATLKTWIRGISTTLACFFCFVLFLSFSLLLFYLVSSPPLRLLSEVDLLFLFFFFFFGIPSSLRIYTSILGIFSFCLRFLIHLIKLRRLSSTSLRRIHILLAYIVRCQARGRLKSLKNTCTIFSIQATMKIVAKSITH